MGYLPIILAILGFLFLWAIVNYQSIRIRKSEIDQAVEKIFLNAQHRNEVLKGLFSLLSEEDPSKEILELIMRKLDKHTSEEITIANKLEHETQVDELIVDIPPPRGHTEYEDAYGKLKIAHNTYKQSVASYRNRVREYNELVKKNPTRLLATLIGSKPLEKV